MNIGDGKPRLMLAAAAKTVNEITAGTCQTLYYEQANRRADFPTHPARTPARCPPITRRVRAGAVYPERRRAPPGVNFKQSTSSSSLPPAKLLPALVGQGRVHSLEVPKAVLFASPQTLQKAAHIGHERVE